MQILDIDQATAWSLERKVERVDARLVSLRLSALSKQCLRATATPRSPVLNAMALLLQDLAEPDPMDFGGALVWLRQWGIWGDSTELPGWRMLELVRRGLANGGHSPIMEKSAHLFGPQEFVDAQLFLAIPLMSQWDVYVIPASGRCLTLVSHDEYIQIDTVSEAVRSRIWSRFTHLGWHPRECPP